MVSWYIDVKCDESKKMHQLGNIHFPNIIIIEM